VFAALTIILAACLGLLTILLPWWAVLAYTAVAVVIMLFVSQPQGLASRRNGTRFLAGCFMLLPMTGVEAVSVFSLAHVGAAATLLVFLLRRPPPSVESPILRSSCAWAAISLFVGASIAAYWNDAAESVVEIGGLLVAAVLPMLALRHFRPSWDEALLMAKGWLVGALVSGFSGLLWERFPSGRAAGFSAHPNQLAMTSAMALPLIWGIYKSGRMTRLQAAIAVTLSLAYVWASGSRSGLLAIMLGAGLILWRSLGIFKAAVVASLGAAAAYLVVTVSGVSLVKGSSAVARLLDDSATQNSNEKRLRLMQAGVDRVDSLGTGLLGAGWIREDQPHNLFLLAWGGAGLIGVIGLLVLFYRAFSTAIRLNKPEFDWALGVTAAVFLTATLVNNALHAPFAWVFFLLMDFQWRSGSGVRGLGRRGKRTAPAPHHPTQPGQPVSAGTRHPVYGREDSTLARR
jgi:O-antigen ligase